MLMLSPMKKHAHASVGMAPSVRHSLSEEE
jgi:hypothetical protein